MLKRIAAAGSVLLAVILLLVGSSTPASACTSFAVYGDEPIYGKNYDYEDVEMRFVVTDGGMGQDYFTMNNVVFMNVKGLFGAKLAQSPAYSVRARAAGELYIDKLLPEVMSMQRRQHSLDVVRVLENIQDKKLVHRKGSTSHTIIADAQGDAAIIEAGRDENEILPIDGDFIVMTNFPNSNFKEVPYDQVTGMGADRYMTAHRYIQRNLDEFDVQRAFSVLALTAQEHTLCSMVFAPAEKSVYLALDGEFLQRWKISISERTMETYQGFSKDIKLRIPDGGVLASDLRAGDFSNYEVLSSGIELVFIVRILAGVLLVALAVFTILKIRKALWRRRVKRWREL